MARPAPQAANDSSLLSTRMSGAMRCIPASFLPARSVAFCLCDATSGTRIVLPVKTCQGSPCVARPSGVSCLCHTALRWNTDEIMPEPADDTEADDHCSPSRGLTAELDPLTRHNLLM